MKINYKAIFTFIITVIMLLLTIFTAVSLGNMLVILLISVVLTYILLPIQEILQRVMPKALSALIIIIILIGAVFVSLYFILPVIVNQLKGFILQIPDFFNALIGKIDVVFRWISKLGVNISAEQLLENNINISETVTSFAQRVLTFTLNITSSLPVVLTIPVLVFYFLKDKDYFLNNIGYVVPLNIRQRLNPILHDLNMSLKQYIRAQLLIMLLVGVTTTVGYFIIGIPYTVVLGVFMGLSEMIPYFGPIVGAIPACLVVLMYDPSKFLFTILVIVIIQQIENHLLTPYVMGNTTNIHPVIVIIVLWIASYFFSFFGFLLGVPLYIILREFWKFFYKSIVKAERDNAY